MRLAALSDRFSKANAGVEFRRDKVWTSVQALSRVEMLLLGGERRELDQRDGKIPRVTEMLGTPELPCDGTQTPTGWKGSVAESMAERRSAGQAWAAEAVHAKCWQHM
jgi:hypothetical protein